MKLYIGCDPGKNGGIGFVPESGKPWSVKMPETERDLWEVFDDLGDYECVACIEVVSSSPQMGVVSAFTFGRGYGGLRMALIASEIPLHEVRPAAWQKVMQCRTGGVKNVSKRKAQELFPSLKITHANADALLIAEYARRQKL